MKIKVYVTEEVTYEPIELDVPDDIDADDDVEMTSWIDDEIVDHLDPSQQGVSDRSFEYETVEES